MELPHWNICHELLLVAITLERNLRMLVRRSIDRRNDGPRQQLQRRSHLLELAPQSRDQLGIGLSVGREMDAIPQDLSAESDTEVRVPAQELSADLVHVPR